ncbi:hypothetical protein C9I57_06920 [Trinickia symbiotica]|uniref:Uncharacterized protein n=1 Tax=Trinickia symbiotica TaxID=863227 RepID=A0A2T3XY00_9BURK|nr:hypothetical protein [Trinickia symbiotica]PTB21385.1 hypothetical protein C9I57_06920 [Trinickia symbiotica]
MQIGSALTSYAQQGNATSTDSGWQNRGADGASQDPQVPQLAETAVPTQDAAVSISAEGAAAAARDGAATSDSTHATTPDASAQPDASPVKSFTYGTLGLERPDKPEEETNGYYTAGRWLAAGITLGGLIALVA